MNVELTQVIYTQHPPSFCPCRYSPVSGNAPPRTRPPLPRSCSSSSWKVCKPNWITSVPCAPSISAALSKAIAHAQELQMQLEEVAENYDDEDDSHWRSECHVLQGKLTVQTQENESLRAEIQQLRERSPQPTIVVETAPARVMEDAPPEVMRELQRLRIQLADTEREQRQLQRKLEAAERRHLTVTREREQAVLQVKGLPALQKAHTELQRKYEMALQQQESWKGFADRFVEHFGRGGGKSSSGVMPPEIATIVRKLDKSKQQIEDLEKSLAASRKEIEALQTVIKEYDLKEKDFQEKERQWSTEREEWKQKLENSELESKSRQGQIGIYKRETENLRSLVKTFEDLPIAPRGGKTEPETVAAIRVSLAATEQERDLLQKERDRLSLKETELMKKQQEQRQELDRIREKFIKLRGALQVEKEKVATAEARANQAEALVGSGSFNPDNTRVLHLEETPLIKSLKEEITVLKRQVEAKGDNPSKHDPDKLNQRLKQNFKEQIALFREGVYLMTGYKVDMLHGNPQERPTFRVRSMYAEREEDHLLLKWPQNEATSLDILGTDMANILAKTPSYDYMTKFQSLPAFLASVQLSLFEKQTVMM